MAIETRTKGTRPLRKIRQDDLDRNRFLIYCIEIYKNRHKLKGSRAAKVFFETELHQYVWDCYGALHTCGSEYLLEDFDEFLKNNKA